MRHRRRAATACPGLVPIRISASTSAGWFSSSGWRWTNGLPSATQRLGAKMAHRGLSARPLSKSRSRRTRRARTCAPVSSTYSATTRKAMWIGLAEVVCAAVQKAGGVVPTQMMVAVPLHCGRSGMNLPNCRSFQGRGRRRRLRKSDVMRQGYEHGNPCDPSSGDSHWVRQAKCL